MRNCLLVFILMLNGCALVHEISNQKYTKYFIKVNQINNNTPFTDTLEVKYSDEEDTRTMFAKRAEVLKEKIIDIPVGGAFTALVTCSQIETCRSSNWKYTYVENSKESEKHDFSFSKPHYSWRNNNFYSSIVMTFPKKWEGELKFNLYDDRNARRFEYTITKNQNYLKPYN